MGKRARKVAAAAAFNAAANGEGAGRGDGNGTVIEDGIQRAVQTIATQAASTVAATEDAENATLYGLLRLRLNDDADAPTKALPELKGCALIRELHVYGVLVAAREGEADANRAALIHGED